MATGTLTMYQKENLVRKVVELYFPESLTELFIEDIRDRWSDYVKSLAPNAPDNMFFLETGIFRLNGDIINVPDCKAVHLPCCDDTKGLTIDVDACPDPRLRMTVEMLVEQKKKGKDFKRLLESRRVTINTEAQLKEQLPDIAKHLDGYVSAENLPVAVDVESIAVSIEPVEMTA